MMDPKHLKEGRKLFHKMDELCHGHDGNAILVAVATLLRMMSEMTTEDGGHLDLVEIIDTVEAIAEGIEIMKE